MLWSCEGQPKPPHFTSRMPILELNLKSLQEHTRHWLISEANNAFPKCCVICHYGPGTALQGMRLWTRQASEGKQKSSPELKRRNAAKSSSGNERQRGPLGYRFPPYISLSIRSVTFLLSLPRREDQAWLKRRWHRGKCAGSVDGITEGQSSDKDVKKRVCTVVPVDGSLCRFVCSWLN